MAMDKNNELAGQVAIVTGAARNIGKATVLDLADAGAKVAINVQHSVDMAEETKSEIEDRGGEAMVVQADITQEDEVARMVDAVVEDWGRVDILVNNAAIRMRTAVTDMTLEEWHQVLAIILDGAFLCVRAVVPHMREQGSGTIINMGGLTAHRGATERSHVTAAKAGLVGFTKGLATELARDGITVNCVVPGLIDTVRGATAEVAQDHEQMLSEVLVGRRGRVDEVSAMVRHLCGPHSRYITGQTIHVTGGAYLP
ncbi:MAG: 3-oxoacyl-ACP reductase family protein [Alphaproteobacteria bacterium]|nr:3-oxoacyl-ACP reductase family protein [Alphaproteobacteria bacterium]